MFKINFFIVNANKIGHTIFDLSGNQIMFTFNRTALS